MPYFGTSPSVSAAAAATLAATATVGDGTADSTAMPLISVWELMTAQTH